MVTLYVVYKDNTTRTIDLTDVHHLILAYILLELKQARRMVVTVNYQTVLTMTLLGIGKWDFYELITYWHMMLTPEELFDWFKNRIV